MFGDEWRVASEYKAKCHGDQCYLRVWSLFCDWVIYLEPTYKLKIHLPLHPVLVQQIRASKTTALSKRYYKMHFFERKQLILIKILLRFGLWVKVIADSGKGLSLSRHVQLITSHRWFRQGPAAIAISTPSHYPGQWWCLQASAVNRYCR